MLAVEELQTMPLPRKELVEDKVAKPRCKTKKKNCYAVAPVEGESNHQSKVQALKELARDVDAMRQAQHDVIMDFGHLQRRCRQWRQSWLIT